MSYEERYDGKKHVPSTANNSSQPTGKAGELQDCGNKACAREYTYGKLTRIAHYYPCHMEPLKKISEGIYTSELKPRRVDEARVREIIERSAERVSSPRSAEVQQIKNVGCGDAAEQEQNKAGEVSLGTLSDSPSLRNEHPTELISELGAEIDIEVVPLVRALNAVSGVSTISSCQGDPGEIGNGGAYGSVTFHKGDWREISAFCFDFLFPLFTDMWDDVRVEVMATATHGQQWEGWIRFRNEVIPTLIYRLATRSALLTSTGIPEREAGVEPGSESFISLGRRVQMLIDRSLPSQPSEGLEQFEREMTALWWTAEMKPADVMRLLREHLARHFSGGKGADDPEAFCADCGGPNITWHTLSPAWNMVMRRDGQPEPIICPICFAKRAQKFGLESWQLRADPILYREFPELSGGSAASVPRYGDTARKIVQAIYEKDCVTPTPVVEQILMDSFPVEAPKAPAPERK